MWKLFLLSILAVLWTAENVSCQCSERDIMMVIQLNTDEYGSPAAARKFVEELRKQLRPSQTCTQLGVIVIWKHPKTALNLQCNDASCSSRGLWAISHITSFRPTSVHKKDLLATGIQMATDQLYSKQANTRKDVDKILVLVLSNPPLKGDTPTEQLLTDYHDMRMKVIVVGIGEGRKQNLDQIVVYDYLKKEFETMKDLADAGVRSIKRLIQGRGALQSSILAAPVVDSKRVAQLVDDTKDACANIVDIAFLIDSSGSVRKEYVNEKYFVQRIASTFGIIEAGSHGGVIVFSSHGYIKTLIRFTDFLTTESFNEAIGTLPYYGFMTRIDTALKLAHRDLYTSEGKARPNVKKLLFLVTDGRQNPDFANGKKLDPAWEAEKLHLGGVQIYAVGIGSRVNHTELALITKDKSKVYTATDFKELVSDAFVRKVSKRLCAGTIATQKPITITYTKSPHKPCNKTSKCGCSGNCGCCGQKAPVYINIFKGSNSQNYLMQGAAVNQNGNTNSLGSLGFNSIRSSGAAMNSTTLKDMSSTDIASLIKDLMPYQQQLNGSMKELLRRALVTKKRRKRREAIEAAKN